MTVGELVTQLQKSDKGMEVRIGQSNCVITKVEAKEHAENPDWQMVWISIRQPPMGIEPAPIVQQPRKK